MKKKGANFPFEMQRERELMQAYRKELAECKYIKMDEIYRKVAKCSCSRYWVTEERATIAVSNMLNGRGVCSSDAKGAMYKDIFNRYLLLKKIHPNRPISWIVRLIVNSEAPEFYISPSRVKSILNRAKHRWASR